MAVLIPSLVQLRRELDALAPWRDRRSDGWIGDAAHRDRTSDHNPDETGKVPVVDADKTDEVHAVDFDTDLREYGLSMGMVVRHLVDRARSGAERRLRYIIFSRTIYEASNGWRGKPYTLPDPHISHAHISGSYDTHHEASQASWHLEEIEVALTAQDKTELVDRVATEIMKRLRTQKGDLISDTERTAIARAVWNHEEPDPAGGAPRRTGGDLRSIEHRAAARQEILLREIGAIKPPPPGELPG